MRLLVDRSLRLSLIKQLLSPRFALSMAGKAAVPLSLGQQRYVSECRRRLTTGEYRLVSEPCPCGATPSHDDVCIAQIDRYGLALNSVLCPACGTVRIDPFLDGPSLDHFYKNAYQEMYGRKTNLPHLFGYQRSHYGERIADLYDGRLVAGSAVLEIGCGTGGAMMAFHDRGCFIAGCDLSRELVDYGTSQGVRNLWTGTMDDAPAAVAGRRFDLIYLFHVLEHVRQPEVMLQELQGWLTPRGRILAVVPDLSRIDAHRNPAGDALKFLHIAHKFNFTAPGLERVAGQAQLAAERITPPQRDAAALADARHLSELWMEFSPATDVLRHEPTRVGDEVLRFLLQTEQLFLAGQCPAQQAIAARAVANPPPAPSPHRPKPQRRLRWYDRLPLVRVARRYFSKAGKRAA